MDVKEIRKTNMRALISLEPSQAAFARKVGTDPAYISQIFSAKTKADMGDDLARTVERVYKRPHGWMDHDHHGQPIVREEDQGLWEQVVWMWNNMDEDVKTMFIIFINAQYLKMNPEAARMLQIPIKDADPKAVNNTVKMFADSVKIKAAKKQRS